MFIIEVTDEFAVHDGYERIECRSLDALVGHWEEQTGQSHGDAEENCALLANGELAQLREVDDETQRIVVAEPAPAEAGDMGTADGLGALVGGQC